jgi:hypothetical protein
MGSRTESESSRERELAPGEAAGLGLRGAKVALLWLVAMLAASLWPLARWLLSRLVR